MEIFIHLHLAVAHGHKSTAEILLRNRANVNALGGKHCCTPLHAALMKNNKEMVEMLLCNGANVCVRADVEGNLTALGIAIAKNNKEILEILLIHRGR